ELGETGAVGLPGGTARHHEGVQRARGEVAAVVHETRGGQLRQVEDVLADGHTDAGQFPRPREHPVRQVLDAEAIVLVDLNPRIGRHEDLSSPVSGLLISPAAARSRRAARTSGAPNATRSPRVARTSRPGRLRSSRTMPEASVRSRAWRTSCSGAPAAAQAVARRTFSSP